MISSPTGLAPEVEAAYRRASTALVAAPAEDLALLEVRGEDRIRFLNGLMTCDVKGLAPGGGAYGFFTGRTGKILADGVVAALADRLWIALPGEQLQPIAAHMRSFLIADRVELEPLAGWRQQVWLGPGAAGALGESLPDENAAWSHLETHLDGVPCRMVRLGRAGAPALALWALAEPSARLEKWIEARTDGGAGGPEAGEAREILRVEAGIARFGQDFTGEHFPQESGAEAEAVSYTKGCYLGQEIVARIHYRGQAQHAMRGLRFSASVPALGSSLELEGREVGRVSSAVWSPRAEGAIGLACLHRRGATPGTRLAVADQEAEVRELERITE